MKIILMRHGKPLLVHSNWVASVDMGKWIEHYNLAEVEAGDVPLTSLKLANSAVFIVTSTAPRAVSSVQALGHTAFVTDAMFLEAQLPFALWRFPRLSPFVWAAFFRLIWVFGYSRGSDSIQTTQVRAKVAANQLIALAQQGTVLLVGHGIMNRLLAKELIGLGWDCSSRQQNKYWGVGVYEFKI